MHVDDRDGFTPGFKYHHWELKGVPLRLEVGPRDLASQQVFSARRDRKEKAPIPLASLVGGVKEKLATIQRDMLEKARAFREAHTYPCDSYDELRTRIEEGGFCRAHWCGQGDCEAALKEETKATIRCIELDAPAETGGCVRCGAPSSRRVVIARAY